MATPREKLAQYSSQAAATTHTYPTVQNLLDDIAIRIPESTVTDAWKISRMNDTIAKIWRYMATTKIHTFQTVTTNHVYALSTNNDMRIDTIKSVLVSDSTVNTSTAHYTPYTFCGQDDELTGDQYYEALGSLGIHDIPSTTNGGYFVKVIYEAVPPSLSTDSLSSIPQINPEYMDILKWRVLRDMALSGVSPDVELGNNYQADYETLLNRIRMNYYKRKAKNPRAKFSYKENWWTG